MQASYILVNIEKTPAMLQKCCEPSPHGIFPLDVWQQSYRLNTESPGKIEQMNERNILKPEHLQNDPDKQNMPRIQRKTPGPVAFGIKVQLLT